jgi:hypothetical protein
VRTAGKLIRRQTKRKEIKIMSHANGANGAATHDVPEFAAVASIAADTDRQVDQTSPERLQKIRELLNEPFDPGEIKWRVTATSTNQGKHGPQKRGQLVAYADQRAYTDRLNEVFGEWGWTRSYEVQVAQNFERRAPGDKTKTAVAAKVVVVSKVTIHGLGSHTGLGEEWADDQMPLLAPKRRSSSVRARALASADTSTISRRYGLIWINTTVRCIRRASPTGRCRTAQHDRAKVGQPVRQLIGGHKVRREMHCC